MQLREYHWQCRICVYLNVAHRRRLLQVAIMMLLGSADILRLNVLLVVEVARRSMTNPVLIGVTSVFCWQHGIVIS